MSSTMHKRYCDGLDNSPKSIYRDGFGGKLIARVVVRGSLTNDDLNRVMVEAEVKAAAIREDKEARRCRREVIRNFYRNGGRGYGWRHRWEY